MLGVSRTRSRTAPGDHPLNGAGDLLEATRRLDSRASSRSAQTRRGRGSGRRSSRVGDGLRGRDDVSGARDDRARARQRTPLPDARHGSPGALGKPRPPPWDGHLGARRGQRSPGRGQWTDHLQFHASPTRETSPTSSSASSSSRPHRKEQCDEHSRRVILGASMVAALVASATATAASRRSRASPSTDAYVDTQTCPGIPIDTQLEGHVSVHRASRATRFAGPPTPRLSGHGERQERSPTTRAIRSSRTQRLVSPGSPEQPSTSGSRDHGKLLVDARHDHHRLHHRSMDRPPRGRPAPTLPRRLRASLRVPGELAHTPSSRGWSLRRHPGGFARAEGG